MSQSGTKAKIVFMDWRTEEFQRMEQKRTISVGRTTGYTQKFKTLEVSRLGLPVSHSGQKIIYLSKRPLGVS